jgi:hypothetical protein
MKIANSPPPLLRNLVEAMPSMFVVGGELNVGRL